MDKRGHKGSPYLIPQWTLKQFVAKPLWRSFKRLSRKFESTEKRMAQNWKCKGLLFEVHDPRATNTFSKSIVTMFSDFPLCFVYPNTLSIVLTASKINLTYTYEFWSHETTLFLFKWRYPQALFRYFIQGTRHFCLLLFRYHRIIGYALNTFTFFSGKAANVQC